jgi:hypothetical protein
MYNQANSSAIFEQLRRQTLALAATPADTRASARFPCERAARGRPLSAEARAKTALAQASDDLRESITAYAREMRGMGKPISAAIEEARTLADEARQTTAMRTQLTRADRDALANDMILWVVDAYTACSSELFLR